MKPDALHYVINNILPATSKEAQLVHGIRGCSLIMLKEKCKSRSGSRKT